MPGSVEVSQTAGHSTTSAFSTSIMLSGSKAVDAHREALLDDRDDQAQPRTQGLLSAVGLLCCALLILTVLLGTSYQQNARLQTRLSGYRSFTASMIVMVAHA